MRSFSSSLSRLALLGIVVVVSACQHEIHLAATGAGNHTGSGTGGTGAGTGEDGGGGIPEVILPVDGGSGDAGPVVKMACSDNTTYQPEHSPGYSAADHTMYSSAASGILQTMTLTDKADQMRGVFSGSSGPQYSDIERTYDTPGDFYRRRSLRYFQRDDHQLEPALRGLSVATDHGRLPFRWQRHVI